jgi:hypothetical protein
MKRIALLVLLALVLCGCGAQSGEETDLTTETTLPAVEPTEPSGCYLPDSEEETATDGGVRVYAPEIADAYGVLPMGEELVIFSGTENTTLTVLSGTNRYITASVDLPVRIHPDDPHLLVTDKGLYYFDGAAGELVQLSTVLKEIGRFALPEGYRGEPVVSGDRKHVYYCTADTVWELTLETGLNRMIKTVSEELETASGLLQEGTVLNCRMVGGKQVFLSVENGKTLWQGSDGIHALGSGANWCARVPEGIVDAYVFGTGEEAPRMLIHEAPGETVRYLEGNHLLVRFTEQGQVLCYDLARGTCFAVLTLPEMPIWVAEEGQRIWVLTASGLYSWDPCSTPTRDKTVYSTVRYTLQHPEETGFDRCLAYAREIGERHGVTILLGKEAIAHSSREYDLTGEYIIPVLMQELEKLDGILQLYPAGMLHDAVAQTTGGSLYICLVREVAGSAELGVAGNVGGTQFRAEDDCYIVLAVGMAADAWYGPLYYGLETRLMSNSKACYDWEYLNPKGFDYDYNYILNQSREDGHWLEGEERYFIDRFSMSFPREDRARIMQYAMMADCGEYFATDAMQAKLRALCLGLREAYGLTKSPETFLWEQYLKESLAYTK